MAEIYLRKSKQKNYVINLMQAIFIKRLYYVALHHIARNASHTHADPTVDVMNSHFQSSYSRVISPHILQPLWFLLLLHRCCWFSSNLPRSMTISFNHWARWTPKRSIWLFLILKIPVIVCLSDSSAVAVCRGRKLLCCYAVLLFCESNWLSSI